MATNEDDFEQPKMECPRCPAVYDDFDGFGVLHCPACGFCSHASVTGGVCGFCGKTDPFGSQP